MAIQTFETNQQADYQFDLSYVLGIGSSQVEQYEHTYVFHDTLYPPSGLIK